MYINDIYLVFPEIYLIISSLFIVVLVVIGSNEIITSGKLNSVQIGSLVLLIIINTSLLYLNAYNLQYIIIGESFYINKVTKFLILLVLFGMTVIINLSIYYIQTNSLQVAELFLMFLLISIGFLILVFANDFLSMYMGIELQSLGLYVLATLKQNSIYATEAGLKYFILGAVASCLLVLGISIIYSFIGLNTFSEIGLFYYNINMDENVYFCSLLGFLLILISFLFKVGSAPFHLWLPDVYEGVATVITGFFALVPKIVIFGVIIKLFFTVGDIYFVELKYILFISSFLSILIGSLGAIYQKTIKRLLSYSAISHTGFILLALSLGNIEGLISVFYYIVIYYVIIITVFSLILQIQEKNKDDGLIFINNLGYIYKNNKLLGSGLILIFFSLAGIPPLSGFFSKFYLIISTLNTGSFLKACLIIILSVLSCAYYLKVIRNLIFLKQKKKSILLLNISSANAYIIVWSLGFHVLFLIIGGYILTSCYNLSLFLSY